MPEYLISGRNEVGRRHTVRIKTATAQDALKIMKERGFTDLVLHNDEYSAALLKFAQFKKNPSYSAIVKQGRMTALQKLWRILVRLAIIWFLVALLSIVSIIFSTNSGGLAERTLVAVVAVAVLAITTSTVMVPWRQDWRFDKVRQGVTRARWDYVIRMTAHCTRNRWLAHEFAYYRAQAFAATGRSEEGLDAYRRFCEANEIPDWVGWLRRAHILSAEGKYETSIVFLERALGLSPMNPTLLLELAVAVLRHRHDVRLGRELFECARACPIAEPIEYMVSLVEGIIAIHESRLTGAREMFNRAIDKLKLNRANPLSELVDAGIRLRLATTCAKLRELDEAERQFR